jgi:hypothetical protein
VSRRIACALLVALASCASAGHRWDHRALLQLRAGETTEAETVALLGKPTSRTNLADNQRVLGFQYIEVAYVVTTQAKTVSLLFDEDHLVRIVQAVNISDELLDQVEEHVPIQSRIEVGGGQPVAR